MRYVEDTGSYDMVRYVGDMASYPYFRARYVGDMASVF